MNTKVLFIIPPESQIKDEKQAGSKWPRIGVAYIAGFLRKQGVAVNILDCKVLGLTLQDVEDEVRKYRPNIVGLGPFTEEIYDAYAVCKIVKKVDPAIVTVFGGPHVSAVPERTLKEFPLLDYVFYGEGEVSFYEFVRGVIPENIHGLAYRDRSNFIVNPPAALVNNLEFFSYPAWDLFPIDAYRGYLTSHFREKVSEPTLELPILSARGCPFRCNFCFKTYPGLRNRDAIKIVDEIEYDIKTYGATEFFFVEGTFAADRKQGFVICDEIISRKLNIKWVVETRVNAIDKELLRRMKEAGCTQVEFGVESGDEDVLKKSGKGITVAQVKYAVSVAKEIGFKVGCYFVIGHPYETRESIKRTYTLARDLDPDIMNVGIMIPYPGTKIREMAEKGEGNYRLLCSDWSEYTKQRGGPLELTNLSIKQLQRIQSIEYIKYYMRPKKMLYVLKNFPIDKVFKITKSLLRACVGRA